MYVFWGWVNSSTNATIKQEYWKAPTDANIKSV